MIGEIISKIVGCNGLIERHHKGYCSNGFRFCTHCRKFFGLMPGTGTIRCETPLGPGIQGWGYVLNGPEWLADKLAEIRKAGGYYM